MAQANPGQRDFEAAVASATKRFNHGDYIGAGERLDKAKCIAMEERNRPLPRPHPQPDNGSRYA